MRILLLGGSGILGSEVFRLLETKKIDYVAPGSKDLDITNKELIYNFISNFKPSWIVNCAAWTNVDGAESSFSKALELNLTAVRNIASTADYFGSNIIHISTDYVFDGEASSPYDENSQTFPINKYGESKLQGEQALLDALPDAYIVRTSWLYGNMGKNFVRTMTKKALLHEEAKVVCDQIGSPTSARDLADGIFSILEVQPISGIYHYSNMGSCSWYELAQTIYTKVGSDPALVQPINSDSLKLIAKRPKYSLMSKEKWKIAGLSMIPYWEESLDFVLPEIVTQLS